MIRAAVLGKPVQHSLSPLVHGLIYRELGVDVEYGLFEVDAIEAGKLIVDSFAKSDEEWRGFSLTMPLKEVGFSLPFPIEARALEARSINTVTPSGSFNTDISGMERVIRVEKIEVEEVVILGNGATARSALIAIDSLHPVSAVTIFRRNEMHDDLLPLNGRSAAVGLRSTADLTRENLNPKSLVISTIPGSSQNTFAQHLRGFNGMLLDVSYTPWPSALAQVVSGKVISGLNLLVAQAVDQAWMFSGIAFDRDEMYAKTLSSTVSSLGSSH